MNDVRFDLFHCNTNRRESSPTHRPATTLLACLLLLSAGVASSQGAAIDLGQATGLAVLLLPGATMNLEITVKGGAAVNGDVGVSNDAHLDLGSGAKVGTTAGTDTVVSGTIFLDPDGATVKLDGQPPSSVVLRQLDQAVADALAANATAAALTPTQTFATLDVSGPFTINATQPGLNVISVDDIKLHGDGILTLNGSASDKFIFNITGDYTMSSKSTLALMGGVTFDNILWNFIGTGSAPNLASSGVSFGTFLAPDRGFSVDDHVLFGSIITGGHLAIGSKALVVNEIPEVSSFSVLFAVSGMVVILKHYRRERFPAAV